MHITKLKSLGYFSDLWQKLFEVVQTASFSRSTYSSRVGGRSINYLGARSDGGSGGSHFDEK